MAKWDEREGNSCHIHCSFWDGSGSLFPAADGHGMSDTFRHFIAGQLAYTEQLTYFFAPNINSYKRFAWGSFAPTTLVWGTDNRTCAFRVVGHGNGLRLENRMPGADCNAYLAFAAIIAAGLRGIDEQLPLEDAYSGNAYDAKRPAPHPRLAARRHRAARGIADGPGGIRLRRGATTTCTTLAWNSARSTPPSPTGSGSAASSGCSRPERSSDVHHRHGRPADRG